MENSEKLACGEVSHIEFLKEMLERYSDKDWKEFRAISYIIRHAERSHLVPLNELEVTKLLMKVKNDYDNLTDFERFRLPIGSDGPRLYAEAICKKFGTPKIKWPEKPLCPKHDDNFIVSCAYCNDAVSRRLMLDACRRAYEEAGGKNE